MGNASTKDQIKLTKLKLSAVSFDAVALPSEDMERTLVTKANFALLLLQLSGDIKTECELDVKEIENLLNSALKLEAAYPNSSNTLLFDKKIHAFIIDEREKLLKKVFESGLLQYLKELILSIMEKLLHVIDQPIHNQNDPVIPREHDTEELLAPVEQPSISNKNDTCSANEQVTSAHVGIDIPEETVNIPQSQYTSIFNNNANQPRCRLFSSTASSHYQAYYPAPILYMDNFQVDLSASRQIVNIYSNEQLPQVFWTPVYNRTTGICHMFLAQKGNF